MKFKKEGKPFANLAAKPGHGTHGMGLGLDFVMPPPEAGPSGDAKKFRSAEYAFLYQNAPLYDIYNAGKQFSAQPEPWHYDYLSPEDPFTSKYPSGLRAMKELGLIPGD